MNIKSQSLVVTPRDPVIARDGRPFGAAAGNRMKSLDWPTTSSFAGAARTLAGKLLGLDFRRMKTEDHEMLRRIAVAGPLPLLNGGLFFPRPADFVLEKRQKDGDAIATPHVYGSRPMRDDPSWGGVDLDDGLAPALLPDSLDHDFKPAKAPAFWSQDAMLAWLSDDTGAGFAQKYGAELLAKHSAHFLESPKQDVRTHVKIHAESFTSDDGNLFSTTGLDFTSPAAHRRAKQETIQIAARIGAVADELRQKLRRLNELHTLGGERRLTCWQSGDDGVWEAPERLGALLADAPASPDGRPQIRLVLATPACFTGDRRRGWLPSWLRWDASTRSFQGFIPGWNVAPVRLVSAVVDRWRPLSGWSYEKGGPKAVRRLTPAGSTYFFEVTSNSKEHRARLADLASCWLQPLYDAPNNAPDGTPPATELDADEQQHRLDGMGLALWGIWDRHPG